MSDTQGDEFMTLNEFLLSEESKATKAEIDAVTIEMVPEYKYKFNKLETTPTTSETTNATVEATIETETVPSATSNVEQSTNTGYGISNFFYNCAFYASSFITSPAYALYGTFSSPSAELSVDVPIPSDVISTNTEN